MYVQVITFSLNGISEEEYLDAADQLAGRLANAPGLLAKVWLENESANRYGGVFFWDDLESMQRYGHSDLFEGRVTEFADAHVEEFSVLENLTRQTQPVLEVLEGKGSLAGASASAAIPVPAVNDSVARPAPPRKRTPPPRKPATSANTSKAPANKASAKKASAKKASAKKASAKKASARKAATRASR